MSVSDKRQRGLTFRSFVVCLFALFTMSAWIEYTEKFCNYGGPFAENMPPNSAVAVILGVMGIGWVLYQLKGSLRLAASELVVIYASMVIAAPMMTQGLWGRFFGLVTAIPNNEDFKSYDSLPTMLWPHGDNLVNNGKFTKGNEGYTFSGDGKITWEEIDRGEKGKWNSPILNNGQDSQARSTLSFEISHLDAAGKQKLVPNERFLFSMLVRAEEFQKGSSYEVSIHGERGPPRTILIQTTATKPTFANPCGFQRVGANAVPIPADLGEKLIISVTLSGAGKITLQDIEFMNVEAIEGLYSGRNVVNEKDLSTLSASERNFTVVKPANMFSLAGLKYLVTGFIPISQWIRPAISWSILVGALFIGFLGLNMLMARQWQENERFSFPLIIIPHNLFAESTEADGKTRFVIFRNRVMWIGFFCTLPLVILKGLHFYNTAVPAPAFPDIGLSQYVSSPLAKAFLADVTIGGTMISLPMVSFSVLAIALLIETNVLFSLWVTFLLFQLWNLCGPAFNFNRFPGYPWRYQQAMGAFIAFAILALFVGRRHLAEVFCRIFRRMRPNEASPIEKDVWMYRLSVIMIVACIAVLAAWGRWTGMGIMASLLFFGYMLALGFAASKLRAECGAPFSYITPYFGMQFVAAMGGFAIFGSTGMLVATIASGFMTTASFLLMAPAQVEMLELGRHFNVRRRDIGAGLTLGVLGGLFLGGFAMLCWGYGIGANNLETSWPYQQNWYYDNTFRGGAVNADQAMANGTLYTTPETRPLNFAKNVDAKGMGIGALVTFILAFLRSQFMWFPLHPVGYLLASSYFMSGVFALVVIAWVIRQIVFRVGGAKTIRYGLVPFCVGMFLASIASIFIFDIAGFILRAQGVVEIYNTIP